MKFDIFYLSRSSYCLDTPSSRKTRYVKPLQDCWTAHGVNPLHYRSRNNNPKKKFWIKRYRSQKNLLEICKRLEISTGPLDWWKVSWRIHQNFHWNLLFYQAMKWIGECLIVFRRWYLILKFPLNLHIMYWRLEEIVSHAPSRFTCQVSWTSKSCTEPSTNTKPITTSICGGVTGERSTQSPNGLPARHAKCK